MDVPLTDISVKISDWMNLLKTFSFFNKKKIVKSIEKFKTHILEETDNVLDINALEFLKSTYSFFISKFEVDKEQARTRIATNKQTVIKKLDLLKFNNYKQKREQIKLGKSAKKFGEGNTTTFKNSSNNDLNELRDLERTIYKQARQKRVVQNDYYQDIKNFK